MVVTAEASIMALNRRASRSRFSSEPAESPEVEGDISRQRSVKIYVQPVMKFRSGNEHQRKSIFKNFGR
jgi:hypothetical protein